ncbi:putative Ketosynthase family 3 (KS3) domain-containing protein [Seiridium unicorne]|uniref:Ketosynthase family 3 (KS3) domain-containing protein n=1 Tax=Seiridium unicorne TaxID=138068 RepID=A0ABR2VHZ7_9PEZI
MPSQVEDIAIIGSACRFPGDATTLAKLWSLLSSPRPVATNTSGFEGYYHENGQYHGHTNVREAYLLGQDEVKRQFDAGFFGINPAEASTMDPQSRLLLEVVYESLETSGQTIEDLKGSNTAVYVGQMVNDYEILMYRDHDTMGTYHATGTSRAMMSNRVSHFFDWHGPSITIDTACSSSLVAVHYAIQQLRSGHSHVAVVAGSNLILDANFFIAESNLQMLSPEGRSRMWDANANGYARGEGVAAIILKMRREAEADGDGIECIIRETALNQDGKTPGLTLPSASAQAQLIRDCYVQAGLDISMDSDRPQYYEAHGTGTPAGDPIEAEAISSTFFPAGRKPAGHLSSTESPLYTIIGHTEGTAGIAGLLRASLALQNATIPPNLLFERLNPHIQPFYDNLHIPTSLTPWPAMATSTPRRASVNSFGFGGTNAHAILESYTQPAQPSRPSHTNQSVFLPFVFSAASEVSLKLYLSRFRDYLQGSSGVDDLSDIAYSLYAKRTRLSVATAIGASTFKELSEKLVAKLETVQTGPKMRVGVRVTHRPIDAGKPRVLGVFTGQGAQWARMGYELLSESPTSRRIITNLQSKLDQLPNADHPAWSLLQELGRDVSSSRVMEAEISQPLCTAIQILQVDLMRSAGIEFAAVIGHSSGEIAAAYAAHLISAEDAICIAYYRGLLAGHPSDQKGAMMAVGTSAEDAQDLLDFPEFKYRACIAAVNSATSVTLSGDVDALEELKIVFKDEKKPVRTLRVDKAYHSHHMDPLSAKYLSVLTTLDIQVGPGADVHWLSSVYGSKLDDLNDLKGPYWCRNMTSPVLFMQAVERACDFLGVPDMVVELGPHPALKGPTIQVIHDTISQDSPYTGLFQRGVSATTSLADGLGYVWTYLGKQVVDLQSYNRFVTGGQSFKLVKDLPGYAWDHGNEYWHESRFAKAARLRSNPVHELLGHLTPDSTEQDMRWRHILRLSEMKWLEGHRLQNLVVFPASGYIASVLEAAVLLCKSEPVTLVEIYNVEIISALVFGSDNLNIEIILTFANITRHRKGMIEASFKYHASGQDTNQLELKACGHVRIQLGQPCRTSLPARRPRLSNLLPVSKERFYDAALQLDYQYSGQFRALERLERKLGAATGFISIIERSNLLVHPGLLDAAFQSLFLTHSAPGDGAYSTLTVPRRIGRITVNPSLHKEKAQNAVAFDSTTQLTFTPPSRFCDIDLYPEGFDHAMMQIEALEEIPLSRQTSKDDTEAFANILWDVAVPNAERVTYDAPATSDQLEWRHLVERVAAHHLRVLKEDIPSDHPSRTEGPYKRLFEPTRGTSTLSCAKDISPQAYWEHDTAESIAAKCEPYADRIDIKLLAAFGENLIETVKRGKPAMDDQSKAVWMDEWYANGFGISTYASSMAQILKQIAHRYPRMHILEIRRDMGAATKAILDHLGQTFATFTVTGPTSDNFIDGRDDILFHPSDLSKGLHQQGLFESSYDVIVASLSLHTTVDLDATLRNVRRLLRPGGYLLALELLPSAGLFFDVIFGSSPDWWHVSEERQTPSPAVALSEWDSLLRNASFSGIDICAPDDHGLVPFSIFASQAVNEKISFLREPLSLAPPGSASPTLVPDLLILAENDGKTLELSDKISEVLAPYLGASGSTCSISNFASANISPNTVLLCLADLSKSIFERLDSDSWKSLKMILLHPGTVCWVTHGRLAENPYSNMMVGLVRSAVRENPALDYLFLDFDDACRINHCAIAENLLRHMAVSRWRQQDGLHITAERELVVDMTGQIMIPRVVMNAEMNDRYNSSRREIRRLARSCHHPIGIHQSNSLWDIEMHSAPCATDGKNTQIHTTQSLVSPIRVAEFTYMFLVLGEDHVSKEAKIALSPRNGSHVFTHGNLSVAVQIPSKFTSLLLRMTALHLAASMALRGLAKGDKVLVFEPSLEFAFVIAQEASLLGVQVTCATENENPSDREHHAWLVLHTATSARGLSRLANDGFSAFIDMSPLDTSSPTGARIADACPLHCRKEYARSLFGEMAQEPSGSHVEAISGRLIRSVTWACNFLAHPPELDFGNSPAVATNTSPEWHDAGASLEVFTWNTISEVSIKVRPVDSQISFADNKTYWLVGLSGGLGLSLCEWMVQHGARYFVITSRKPKVESKWLDEMDARGVVVKIMSCDVTQRDQVFALHDEIRVCMPVIAGVVQGAMVLQDTTIQNMTLEQLLEVTRPKVEGSIHLNDIFQEYTLDFFVFLSSVSSVIGNHGQANYGAANTFMASVAEQRRRRGLAASVIHIGFIIGVGLLTRTKKSSDMVDAITRAGGFVPTSERDFHQLFGEAVLAGRPGSTAPISLVSGLRKITQSEEHPPVWESWPQMSHFVVTREKDTTRKDGNIGTHMSVKECLAAAHDSDEVYSIIWDAFICKIASQFKLNVSQIDPTELGDMRFEQMGIDSLTAVEVRAWFMTTLEVNIPVLKILSGSSVRELVLIATETVPSQLVPGIKGHLSGQPGSVGSATSQETAELDSDTYSEVPSQHNEEITAGSNPGIDYDNPLSATVSGLSIRRSVPVSFTQARFYPSGLFLEDRVGLNHTVWAHITGHVQLERLRNAIKALQRQHEILRTAFFNHDGQQMQHILDTGPLHLEYQQIREESDAADIAMSIQKKYVYDVARGETVRMILLSRPETDDVLVIGLHPLVLDATSFQIFCKWLAFHYNYPHATRRVKQFADCSEKRHRDLKAGKYQVELEYWRREFTTPPPPLPLLTLAKVQERCALIAYENVRGHCKIDSTTRRNIASLCRRLKATPFHFYLAVLRALLLRYTTGGEDVTIAVAESGRGDDAEEMDVIGPLYNLLLVRLRSDSTTKFESLLEATRAKTLDALANSKLPYTVLVKELGLQRTAQHFPFFQVFADYRMGQSETATLGEDSKLKFMGFDLNVPYDVYLDTIDDPIGDCTHHFFLRRDLFDEPQAEQLSRSYERLVRCFAVRPETVVGDVDLFEPGGSLM